MDASHVKVEREAIGILFYPRPAIAVKREATALAAPQRRYWVNNFPARTFSRDLVITPVPVTLEGNGVRLEPMATDHRDGLAAAASDGRLWELWYTSVPSPESTATYIADALAGQKAAHMLPWVVRDLSSGAIAGSTRYHDIVREIDRVEIGYTWYGGKWQRSHVNSACKLLLLTHAFETLGCKVVGLRTDNFNFASQKAIEALGAKKDGVIRHHLARKDGSVRDSVIYSILLAEWPDVKRHLELRLARGSRQKI